MRMRGTGKPGSAPDFGLEWVDAHELAVLHPLASKTEAVIGTYKEVVRLWKKQNPSMPDPLFPLITELIGVPLVLIRQGYGNYIMQTKDPHVGPGSTNPSALLMVNPDSGSPGEEYVHFHTVHRWPRPSSILLDKLVHL